MHDNYYISLSVIHFLDSEILLADKQSAFIVCLCLSQMFLIYSDLFRIVLQVV